MSQYASHLAGRSYGRLGTVLADPPQIPIHGYATSHALHRAVGRTITSQDRMEIVRNPVVVLEQAQGYSYLFLSERGVVVLTGEGLVRTTYGSSDFDDAIRNILADAGVA
ncbi:MAG: hypothetical protein HUU21_40755 [Polyangiaceae bacterium]|nr:hypothetical protein [Polyangiaceae bacterium]NUQ79874.1 hypothetical protein [Polyangiaceae bacterium]